MPKYCVHAGGEVQILDCVPSVDKSGCLHLDLGPKEVIYNTEEWGMVHPRYVKVKGCPNFPLEEKECQNSDTVPIHG